MQRILAEKEAEDFLEKEKFPIVERKIAKTKEEAVKAAKSIGFPIVLKLSSKNIIHKTELNAVKTDLRNEQELEKALKEMPQEKDAEFLVQKFVKGKELLVGLKKDTTFGHVLLFGSGGIYTEVLKDVSMRILPASRKELEKMFQETKAFQILTARGKKTSTEKILDVLEKTANLAGKYPSIEELDINPLIVNENECMIADARIVMD